MKTLKSLLLLLVACITMPALAQQVPPLPADAAVRIGKLPNGLTYYIRHNEEPKQRADFYIAQKVGAVQEDDNQRGLAHFLEHMCFNGTDNFPGNGVVRFCESIGVKFGQNLNAYTAADETVYNICDVPVSNLNIDSCLLVLHDWADGLVLDPEEIDKERGVIHEEWRMRSSASQRIFERNLEKLYPNSRYGKRMPIGLMEIIDNFSPEFLRAYYEKWYRPDLQGIIVVGDVDVDYVENKIKELFSPIQMPENPAPYELYPVPDTPEAIYVIDKDKEQQQSIIQMMFKHEPIPEEYRNTVVFYQMDYLTSLALISLNARLNEMSQKPDCPFIGAGAEYDTYIMSKTCDALTVALLPKPGQDAAAVQAVMQEVLRAAKFGFTGTELLRARDEYLSQAERIYDNRDKQKNSFFIKQYVENFLEGDPIPGIETEWQLLQMFKQQMPTDMLTQAASGLFAEYAASTDTNFVFLAFYPETNDVKVPTADEMKQAVAAAKAAPLEAYVDNVKDEPLVPTLPKKGKIVKEEAADFGYTCWTLQNGAKVYFKQTDFNDSQVLFNATSFGGLNKITDKDLVNATLLPQVMNSTGLGNFNATELEKKMAGKQASVMPALSQTTETLTGSSTPKDLRTLFELLYLRFQKPANDVDGYNNCISALRSALENADKVPEKAFSDSVTATVYGHNPRVVTLKLADLDKADYATIQRIYTERFNTAGDFDFYFTGAFNTDSLRAFTEQYIASLPAQKKREQYTDLNVRPVKGVVENRFVRTMETPKSNIIQVWSGETPYSLKESYVVDALGEILTQRYLKSIREEGSMAYSVWASGKSNFRLYDSYSLQITCPVKPAKADSALYLMKVGIDDIAKNGVTEDELSKVREFSLKQLTDSQRENSFWQSLILTKVQWGKDEFAGAEEAIKSVSSDDIRKFVNNVLLRQNNCITVLMLPADFTE